MIGKIVWICLSAVTCCSFISAKTLRPYYLDYPEDVQNSISSVSGKEYMEALDEVMRNVEAGDCMARYFVLEEAIDPADSVSSLLGAIRFDQGTPYNNDCPQVQGGRAVTGCIATAMAQIMYYYRYPEVGTGTVYYGSITGQQSLNLASHPFDWANILPYYSSYSPGYSATQAAAVANLMLCCGASIGMNYSSSGSGANTNKVPSAMKTNFGYAKSVACYTTINEPDPQSLIEDDWVYTIREELQAHHPIIYSGCPAYGKSGHCFVIDGYKVIDQTYYYHVNWGWNGAYNGYFLISKLQPDPADPSQSYSGYGCEMVVGIVPPDWSAVEDVHASSCQDGAIYNILGTRVREDNLQHGCIYIRNGHKFLY